MQSRRSGFLAALFLAAFASAPAEAGAKKYFLTVDGFPPSAALDACGKGYHMATLWEIFDPTVLKYDAKRGRTRADSGSGPAAQAFGWVRTGGTSYAGNLPGTSNCSAWTSNGGADYGTTVELHGSWADGAIASSPWSPSAAPCDNSLPVWCKQN